MHVPNWVTVRLKWDILWVGPCTVCKDLYNWRLSIKTETHPNYGNQQQTPPPLELLKRKSHPQDLANLPSLCPLLSGRAFPLDSFGFWVKCPRCFADLCEPLLSYFGERPRAWQYWLLDHPFMERLYGKTWLTPLPHSLVFDSWGPDVDHWFISLLCKNLEDVDANAV